MATLWMRFEDESVSRAREVLEKLPEDSVTWSGSEVKVVADWGVRSKWAAFRPASYLLHDAAKPFEDSSYYEPLPQYLRLEVEWVEPGESPEHPHG